MIGHLLWSLFASIVHKLTNLIIKEVSNNFQMATLLREEHD